MFCPPDYVLLQPLLRRLLDRSYAILPPDQSDSSAKDPEQEQEQKYDERMFNVMFALRQFLYSCPSLSVCSPKGILLRVSPEIVAGSPTGSIFEYVNPTTWLVRNPEPYQPSEGMTPGMAKVVAALMGTQERRAHVFSAFEGWSLTIHRDDVPENEDGFDRFLTDGGAFFSSDEDDEDDVLELSRPRGRPKIRDMALEAFNRLYPKGRKQTPWRVVEEEVSGDIGKPVSADTIRRALGIKS